MSVLSNLGLISHWKKPVLTWCRLMYIKRHVAGLHSYREYSKYSDHQASDNDYTEKDNIKHGDKQIKNHKTLEARKLFRPRRIKEMDTSAELENTEMLSLSESDQFGTGVGPFKEIPVKEEKRYRTEKKSTLPSGWSDTFGTMVSEEVEKASKSTFADNEKYWDDFEKEEKATKFYQHIRLSRYNRRHVPNWYARRIEKLGEEGKVREAIEVFDKWMIEQDRVKPTSYEFQVLIDLLARVGYTKKAFQLYNQMCCMKLHYPNHVYTSLFNACANSPWPDNGLRLANRLQTKMLVKKIQPNYITYLAMIKAFGKCGDINTAFSLADQAARLQVTDDLLNNLLVACVSDKESGFRHAIVVWRKFKTLGVQPSLSSYNLLLRTVHECGIGEQKLVAGLVDNSGQHLSKPAQITEAVHTADTRSADLALRNISKLQKQKSRSFKDIDKLLEKYEVKESEIEEVGGYKDDQISLMDTDSASGDIQPVNNENKEWWQLDIFKTSANNLTVINAVEERLSSEEVSLPDILDPNEDYSRIVQIDAVETKEERLALLGGLDGFLKTLHKEKITPDIVTYTQLAQVVPDYLEDQLIEEMWAEGVKPDIDFYNLLIAKRAKRNKQDALKLYKRLRMEDLVPDIRTFSCLAFLCYSKEEGMKLLEEMLAADIMPNNYTFGALLWASGLDFQYKKDVLRKMQELGAKPNARVIEMIEGRIKEAKTLLLKYEKKRPVDEKQKKQTERFGQKLTNFINFYEKWSQYNCLEEEQHPWRDFMEEKKYVVEVQ